MFQVLLSGQLTAANHARPVGLFLWCLLLWRGCVGLDVHCAAKLLLVFGTSGKVGLCSIQQPEGTETRKSCLLIGSGMLPTPWRREFSGFEFLLVHQSNTTLLFPDGVHFSMKHVTLVFNFHLQPWWQWTNCTRRYIYWILVKESQIDPLQEHCFRLTLHWSKQKEVWKFVPWKMAAVPENYLDRSPTKRQSIPCLCLVTVFVLTPLLVYHRPKLDQLLKGTQNNLKSTQFTKLKKGEYRWEPGLKFNHTCRLESFTFHKYMYPCCSSDLAINFQEKHFVSELGDLSLTQVTHTFLKKISNKRVLFIGDSVMRQFTRSIWDVLAPGLKQELQNVTLTEDPLNPKSPIPSHFYMIEIHRPAANITFKFVMFCVVQNSTCKTIHPCVWNWNHLKLFIKESDIVVFNMGLHFAFCPRKSFRYTLKKMTDFLKIEVSTHPEKQVILRSTLPQHFPTTSGYKDHLKTRDITESCPHRSTTEEHWSNEFMRNISQQFGFKYLDSFPIYKDRWDLHWKPNDCTHNCYTAETTVPDLALLNNLLKWAGHLNNLFQQW